MHHPMQRDERGSSATKTQGTRQRFSPFGPIAWHGATPSKCLCLTLNIHDSAKESKMTEWPTKEIENDRIIVYCAEGEYELVDTAKARFQMLDVEERRDALSRANDLLALAKVFVSIAVVS
jgi:hypothetical protein